MKSKIIPYKYEIDHEQNVITEYWLQIDNYLVFVYKLYFYSKYKNWKIESKYVKLDIEEEFLSFSHMKEYEKLIIEKIPEFTEIIKRDLSFGKLDP